VQEIAGIPKIANRNSNFLTLQKLKFQKKNPTVIFGIENGSGIPLPMGVPEIGTKNWNSQPNCQRPYSILMKSADLLLMLPTENFPHVLMRKKLSSYYKCKLFCFSFFVLQIHCLISLYKFVLVSYHKFVY
jgi:hypothetical protein